MQNKATWLETRTDGYKVRVQFLPINEAEAKRCSLLLMNADVKVIGATTQGPLSIDLLVTPKVAAPTAVIEQPTKVVADPKVIALTVPDASSLAQDSESTQNVPSMADQSSVSKKETIQ